jgi:hypothetical protein
MQVKTIKKQIENKLNEWLSTIDNENLRKQVKDNLLVSGGSIASMFLNEDVNDYDIYIQDINVLLELTKYYAKADSNVEVWDGRNKDKMINDYKKYIFTEEAFNNYQSFFASQLRNLQPNQIKLFVGMEEKGGGLRIDPLKYVKNEDGTVKKYQVAFLSPNAVSLTDDIQIVIRFHGSPEQIHKTFDFIHATNYFTFKDGLVTNNKALLSLLSKQLSYQGSLYPLTSIIRSRKFIKRNWNIGAGEYLKIMFQISLLDLTNLDILEEQLIGVDVAYFSTLIEALRKAKESKDDFVLTPEYMNELIERIFNED